MNLAALLQLAVAKGQPPVPWVDPDVSTLSYDSVFGYTSSATVSLWFSYYGDDHFVLRNTNPPQMRRESMSSAWDLSTASFAEWGYFNSISYARSIWMSNDGTKLALVVYPDPLNTSYSYPMLFTMSTPWSPSTATYASHKYGVLGDRGIYFTQDGLKMYVGGSHSISQYDLSTAWDLSTATYVGGEFYSTTQYLKSFKFNPDGTKLYTMSLFSFSTPYYRLEEANLTTAWDISSAQVPQWSFNFLSGAITTTPTDFFIKSDGSKVYILDAGTYKIMQCSVSPH